MGEIEDDRPQIMLGLGTDPGIAGLEDLSLFTGRLL